MNKASRIDEFVGTLGAGKPDGLAGFDPCYLGYFECFNSGRYYEAHDVLEHLWLRQGKGHFDHRFYKGLIQLAGAFVHLRLQYFDPEHPKHGRRLAPARRLFLLAAKNLSAYSPEHQGVDVDALIRLAKKKALDIGEDKPTKNPWSPVQSPRLQIPAMPIGQVEKSVEGADWLAITLHFLFGCIVGGAFSLLAVIRVGAIYRVPDWRVLILLGSGSTALGAVAALCGDETWEVSFRVIPNMPLRHDRTSRAVCITVLVLSLVIPSLIFLYF